MINLTKLLSINKSKPSKMEIISSALFDSMDIYEYDSTNIYNKGDKIIYIDPDTGKVEILECNDNDVTNGFDRSKWSKVSLITSTGEAEKITGRGSSSFEEALVNDMTKLMRHISPILSTNITLENIHLEEFINSDNITITNGKLFGGKIESVAGKLDFKTKPIQKNYKPKKIKVECDFKSTSIQPTIQICLNTDKTPNEWIDITQSVINKKYFSIDNSNSDDTTAKISIRVLANGTTNDAISIDSIITNII